MTDPIQDGYLASLQARPERKTACELIEEYEPVVESMHPVTALRAIRAISSYALAEEERRKQGWER